MQRKPTHFKLLLGLTAALMISVLVWSCNDSADSTAAPEASKVDSSAVALPDSTSAAKPDSTIAAQKAIDSLPPVDTTTTTRPTNPGTRKTEIQRQQ